jgi:trk system potassium uptake protein TrkH
MKSKKITISSVHIIMASFLAIILIGTIILSLPICSANGENTSFIDSLFTATTSTCVTGLVVVPTVSHWSVLGQVVILLLIQVGGLGLITVTAGIALVMHKKIGLSDRLLLQDAFNLNTLS